MNEAENVSERVPHQEKENKDTSTATEQPQKKHQRQTLRKTGRQYPYVMSSEEYLQSTTPSDREAFRSALREAVQYFLAAEKQVYLESLGILHSDRSRQTRVELCEDRIASRTETVRTIRFDKCSELTRYHFDQYPDLIETKRLASHAYLLLPLETQLRWGKGQCASILRTVVRAIRDEIIVDGCSQQLEPIGSFFAFHNRQGQDIRDWFAGSDIILDSQNNVVEVSDFAFHERPVLCNAFELFEAHYGRPVAHIEVDLPAELSVMGYDTEEFAKEFPEHQHTLNIVGFEQTPGQYLFCSDGLRSFGLESRGEDGLGCELTFQLKVDSPSQGDEASLLSGDPAAYVSRAFTLGWILIQSSKRGTVTPGVALSHPKGLFPTSTSSLRNQALTGVVTAPLRMVQLPQLANEGPFFFTNLIGITKEEAKLAEVLSAERLLALLRLKSFEQVTPLSRRPIMSHSQMMRDYAH